MYVSGKPISQKESFTAAHASEFWTIAPGQSKAVIFIAFTSELPGLFQGFVHIKMAKENLLVPVTISVSKGGLHITPSLVDFHTLITPRQTRMVTLSATNSGEQSVELQEITVHSGNETNSFGNLHIAEFDPVVVPPRATLQFGKVLYTPDELEEGIWGGMLKLTTNDTVPAVKNVMIPYVARILFGSFGFMKDQCKFRTNPKGAVNITKVIMVSNNFREPVHVHSAQVNDSLFSVSSFFPQVIQPAQAKTLLTLRFTAPASAYRYAAQLELATNVSALQIPLTVYHNMLNCGSAEVGRPISDVDFSSIAARDSCSGPEFNVSFGKVQMMIPKMKILVLHNQNPDNVTINNVFYTDTKLTVTVEQILNAGNKPLKWEGMSPLPRGKTPYNPIQLPPGGRVFLGLKISSGQANGTSLIPLQFITSAKEEFNVTIEYEAVQGVLGFMPATLKFEPSFPGKVQEKTIAARSSFKNLMNVQGVRCTDERIIPTLLVEQLGSNNRTEIASVRFDPSKGKNYMRDEAFHIPFDSVLSQEEVHQWSSLQRQWEGPKEVSATIYFDTDTVRGAPVAVSTGVYKPNLVVAGREDGIAKISFPQTHTGGNRKEVLTLQNPADVPVKAQLVFQDSTEDMPESSFHSEHTESVLIPAGEEVDLGPVIFTPKVHQNYSVVVYLRNNLTMLEPIMLVGEGGSARLVFENDALNFDITAAELVTHRPVYRTFEAVNDRDVAVQVTGMTIGGAECKNYGFEIVDCHSFTIGPRASYRLQVSYLPDFSILETHRELKLVTEQGPLTIPLNAVLPAGHFQKFSHDIWHERYDQPFKKIFLLLLCLVIASVVLVLFIDAQTLRRKLIWTPSCEYVMIAQFPSIDVLTNMAGASFKKKQQKMKAEIKPEPSSTAASVDPPPKPEVKKSKKELARERLEKERAERAEREKAEKALRAEKAAKQKAERAAQAQKEAEEKTEKERLKAEKLEKEKAEKEKRAEEDRIRKEKEKEEKEKAKQLEISKNKEVCFGLSKNIYNHASKEHLFEFRSNS